MFNVLISSELFMLLISCSFGSVSFSKVQSVVFYFENVVMLLCHSLRFF